MNRLNFKQFFAAFALLAMSVQMFSFSIFAQSLKNEMSQEVIKTNQDEQADLTPKSKIAPDLEEKSGELSNGLRADEPQKVIIQLKSETSLNEMLGNTVNEAERAKLFEREVQANKSKKGLLMSDLTEVGGTIQKSFNNLGLVSAELPLSKITELAQSENVAYISPDREASATGHVETTTGTNLVRSLVSGTTLDGRGIGVAVIDSSYYIDNELFRQANGTMIQQVNQDMRGWNMMVTDGNGHGTHVSSLIAGNPSFVGGYYSGVAPGVKIINVRVLDAEGKGNASHVIGALDWIIANKSAHNIRVVNMSLGTPASQSYKTDPLCLAARRAVNAGIVVVASAGNNGKDAAGAKRYGSINSPGIEPSVITVGATNTYGTDVRSDDTIASYSSKGPTRGYETVNGARVYDNLIKPDLVAPGNKLIGAQSTQNTNAVVPTLVIYYPLLNARQPDYYYDWNTSTFSGLKNGTMFLSGTSMSAPLVSGAAALMLQANPSLTPNLVKAILMYSAQPMNGVNTLEQGAGQLNIDGAVRLAKLVKTTLPTTNGSSLLTASLPKDQRSTIAGQYVYWGKGVVTNYGFLSGNDLMNKWQKMYANGVLISDGTPFSGSTLTKSTTLTSGTLSLYQGAIRNNGVLISDGTAYLSSNAMGGRPTPFINWQGVLVSDGVLVGDGVLISDGVLVGDGVLISDGNPAWANAVYGDNTAGMVSAGY